MTKKEIHRAQILLEKQQYEKLAAIAAEKGQSVSGILRELIGDYVFDQEAGRRRAAALEALAALTAQRQALEQTYGVYQGDLLEEVRAARESDLAQKGPGAA